MKRQIRRNVFETNSSSMHSLCVMKNGGVYTSEEILKSVWLTMDNKTGEKDCVWDIWNDEDLYFGRSPFRALGTFGEKWKYALASLVKEYNDDAYKELYAIALKYIPGLKRIKLPKTTSSFPDINFNHDQEDDWYIKKYGKTKEEFVKFLEEKEKQFENKIEYWETDDGYFVYEEPYIGGVDECLLDDFLEKENVSLEGFITNRKYVVIQDGDEYCYFKDMKKTGLINMEAIDYEYPKR